MVNWLRRLMGRRPSSGSRSYPGTDTSDATARLDPDFSEVHALGQRELREGRYLAAIEIFVQVVSAGSTSPDVFVNLGFAQVETGQHKSAIDTLRMALSLDSKSVDGHYLLGLALMRSGQPAAAVVHLRHAIVLQPSLLVAHRDLGRALHDAGNSKEALAALDIGLSIAPEAADLHVFAGNIEAACGNAVAAICHYEAALKLDPSQMVAYSNLAPAYLTIGNYERAALMARQALSLDPGAHAARSNLLVALSSSPTVSPEVYLSEARLFGKLATAQARVSDASAHEHAAIDPDRPLRIGFVSADMHSHPVGYFLESLLTSWDASRMERVAYSNGRRHDVLTSRLQHHLESWQEVADLSDDALAALIRRDRIDVLIDLSGHTAGNRLPVFARRLAPLQLSWLGYWASTGVPDMDFVFADAISLPAEHRWQYSERVAMLPAVRFCFSPQDTDDLPVSDLPAIQAGYVTFGSFQRITKINDLTLSLWGRVMRRVRGSRLRLQAAHVATEPLRTLLLERLAAAGIPSTSVDLVEAASRRSYLEAHGSVDMVLDTFPHTGATTTCEALWMGVPTITMSGQSVLSRQGTSLLTAVGLTDWIADDEEAFVAIAAGHGNDIAALARIRSSLRVTLMRSSLANSSYFASAFQALIRASLAAVANRAAEPANPDPS